ncbi:hypothetical protein PR048_005060 [Dryococelus australis]|uniref:Uncharacterized protein n=1 Tax=Dryococelus australis TaxID=614101 RepID=A0ABQ9I8A3_9NEOP|nr:hypothetical protein PR048_005060 [Dryococelus australis]
MINTKREGTLLCPENYFPTYKPFKVWKGSTSARVIKSVQVPEITYPQLNGAKVSDVRSLYRFIDVADKDWIEALFSQSYIV